MTGATAGDQDLRIDSVGPFDLTLLAVLHAACFDDRWDEAALAALLAMPGAFGLLATRAREPAGFLLARVAGGEAEILSIGVAPGQRRRGVAARLIEDGLSRAAAEGAERVFLEVAEDNLAARALYLRYGFAAVGRRPAYYRRPAGPSVAALVMAVQTR